MGGLRIARAGLLASALGVLLLAGAAWAVVRGGQVLRTRHRWAATVWTVDGRSQLALWRGGDQAVIDNTLVNGSAGAVAWFAGRARLIQSGFLYAYAFWMIVGLVLLLGWFLVRL